MLRDKSYNGPPAVNGLYGQRAGGASGRGSPKDLRKGPRGKVLLRPLWEPPKAPPKKLRWVYREDCRVLLPKMKQNIASLILTDPPYFIDGMDDGWDREGLRRRSIHKGVVGLPAGMKFDTKQGDRLREFLTPIAVEWLRVIRPGGFVLCFSQNRLVHHTAMALEGAGLEIRDILVWRYEGQAKAFSQEHFIRKRDIPEREKQRLIKKIGGRKTPQLKPQCEMIVMGQAPRDGTFVDNWDKWDTGLIDVANPLIEPDRFPGTVMPVPKPRERYGHIAAKPVDLMRHLIRVFSREGSLVLDPFTGSGTVGVASRLEGREFIGIELDGTMASVAEKRIGGVK